MTKFTRRKLAAAIAAAIAAHYCPAAVATDWINVGTGDWFTGSNWSGGAIPGWENTTINNGGTARIQAPGAESSFVYLRSGTIEISGGGTLNGQGVDTLIGAGGNATMRVDGAGSSYAGYGTYIGHASAGTVTVTNGGEFYGTNTVVGNNGVGTVNVDGAGSLWISAGTGAAEALRVGMSNAGTINLSNGGIMRVDRTMAVADQGLGTVTLLGSGTLNIGTGGAMGAGGVIASAINGSASSATVNFNHTDAAYSFMVPLTGSLAVVHNGAGMTILEGAGTWTGGTTVNAGVLYANSNGVLPDNTAYVVNGGVLDLSNIGLTAASLAGSGGTVHMGNFNVNQAGNTTFGGALSGGVLVKSGAGELILAGASTHAYTQVNGGTLRIAGTVNNSSGSEVDSVPGSNATAIVHGAGAQWITGGALRIGEFRDGALTISGSGLVSSARGRVYAGAATVDGAGSTWSAGDSLWVGVNAGTGTLSIANGAVVSVGTGARTLTLGMLAAAAGTLNIGTGGAAGTLDAALIQGGAGGATVNFNHTDAAYAFAMPIAGGTAVNHNGSGTTILTGTSTYTGATAVNAGALVVNGSLASAVTVNNGGALGGAGALGGLNVASGGLVAPGNSIGTLTVNGNVAFGAGSTYRVEVDAAGNADRINATGAATLTGGTVDVRAAAGTWQRNTTYTILDAAGGVTGSFSGATSDLAFLTPSLAYGPNSVTLALTRNDLQLSAVAGTPNQTAVSRYLDEVAGSAGISSLMMQIDGLSAAQARDAFASLGADTLSAPASAAMAGTERFLGAISARLGSAGAGSGIAFSGLQLAQASSSTSDVSSDYLTARTRGFWMQADAARGGADGDGNATGFDWRGGGTSFGFDTELERGTVIGAALAYGRSDVDFDANAGSAKVKSPRLALYAGRSTGAWEFKGAAGYADQDFDTRRNVILGSSTTVASATHRGDEWSAYAEAQYTRYKLKPLAGLRYIKLREQGYSETGSAANLTVEGRSTESVVSLLGARYAQALNSERGEFEVRAIWGHEFGDAAPAISGRLAAAPATASFTVAGVPLERDFLVLGAGFANELRKNLFLHADASVELRANGQSQQALTAALRYAW